MKNSMRFLEKKANIELSYDSTIPLLDIYPERSFYLIFKKNFK